MNILKTQVHTIIMLIGPSGSGKSTFAKNVLIPGLDKPMNEKTNYKPNIQYISSDDIRKELLGHDFDKFASVMTESSEQAFDLIFTKLDLLTTYPINAEYIILDTTGLSEEFRSKVLEIGKKNNYNVDAVVFDYKKITEYTKNFEHDDNKGVVTPKRVVVSHTKRLHNEVMRTIKRDKYRQTTRIKAKDFMIESEDGTLLSNMQINVWDAERYEQRILSDEYQWVSIGDIHGCFDELQELLEKLGFKFNGLDLVDTEHSEKIGLIFAGDIVDKSPDEKITETIRFFHKNMDVFGERFQFLLGNHEDMGWRWATDDPTLEKTPERVAQKHNWYITSIIMENDEEIRNMFFDIHARMRGWVKKIGTDSRGFVVTHAPCEVKYLEKMDNYSLMKQIKCASRIKNKDKSIDELTPYLMEEAVKNQPIHIFGHLGQSSVRTYKNKVCIDTGCIYGNSLTAYHITNGFKPMIRSVKSKNGQQVSNDLASMLFGFEKKQEIRNIDIHQLDERDQRRLRYVTTNKIGYIGGTISPAPKDTETGEFESLKTGLDVYKGRVDKVVLQPKYMGSRCQMYLNIDLEQCYATSRNGYKIKQIDLTEVFKVELAKHHQFMHDMGLVELTMDGELMPWAAIGEGLIDRQFRVIDQAIKSEIDFLKENGFDEAFGKLVDQWKVTDYETDKNSLNKKEIAKKYGHDHNNFKYIKGEVDRWQTVDKHEEAWETYHEQIELYGSQGDIHYKPFRILKWKDENGEIYCPTTDMDKQFEKINGDTFHIVDFADKDYLEKAQKWFEKLTTKLKMEGCVIKPLSVDIPRGLPPYMKVRNDDYLTIIYGYDMYFPKKFEKLFRQKNINRKVKVSISEYKMGEQMLNTEIASDEFKQLIANFLFENAKETGIDPRL